GVVLTQQIRTVDFRARGAEFIEAAGEQTREQALHAVRMILG
ncbi:MAG TPA: mRNA-degrading endonuclease, partial [Alcanivorax sp.]|nr:mRNA-degrading endonuclease [Alcanivorax sp.]